MFFLNLSEGLSCEDMIFKNEYFLNCYLKIMSKLLKICKRISDIITPLGKENLEVELKFRKITESDYFFLLKYLQHLYQEKKERTVDYFIKDKRITQKDGKFYLTSKQIMMEPIITVVDGREIKFSVSKEANELLKNKSIKKYDFRRDKDRSSFQVENFRLDLTIVTRDGKEDYEIEIEVVDPSKYDSEKFSIFIEEYLGIMKKEEINVIAFCNNALSGGELEDNEKIGYNYLSRPRDLLKRDITVANSILQGYTVSIKADGVPFFLVLYDNTVYLVSNKSKVSEICPIDPKYLHLEGSIFAGELIETVKLKNPTVTDFMNIFLPFDTIRFKDRVVKDESYMERFDKISHIKDMEIYCKGVKNIKVFEKKIFNLGLKSKSFYEGFRKCYEHKKEVIYHDDGYIFTPVSSPYLAPGQMRSKRERELSKFPDVCKFKPIEKRSIDFKIRDGKLYVYDKRTKREVLFDSLNFSLDFREDIEGKIIEFFPKFTDNSITMIPERIREDKVFPNELEVAKEITNSYTESNPITENTLLGKDTVLMRSFNNTYIKSKLIRDIDGYVIDIGAGNGGDINKYGSNEKIKKILSIEPHPPFSDEFEKRLKSSKFKNKFSLLRETKGEDTEDIINGMKFFPRNMSSHRLNITFMISLSFFWSSRENLILLADTINGISREYRKRSGDKEIKIIFYTIDGYKVEDYFSSLKKDKVNLNTITLSFDGENQVEVDIKDSKTVFKQTEYLVKLDQLFQLVGAEVLEMKNPKVFNILMSEGELNYINLFSYGSASITSKMEIIHLMEKIYIDEDTGIEEDNKILASGEDTIKNVFYLGKNIFRIGTLDLGDSLLHSVMKLVSEEYRDSDVYKRVEFVESFKKKKDIKSLSQEFEVNINIYHGDDLEEFNGDFENTINLLKCKDGEFEPLVFVVNDEVSYTFEI